MENNTKICVYAICRNESKFIDRWISSLQNEADCVVVLDTGSTDDSVEKLKKYEPFVTVKQYDYFKESSCLRFDKARNDSMRMIPIDADVCVVLDLDQVPASGWANIIREEYSKGIQEVYGYIVDHDAFGNENNRWQSKNVHPNDARWFWERIIHEGIHFHGDEEIKTSFREDFIIDHYPDNAKDRSQYLKILENAAKTYPKDPYYGIYYGIEMSRRGSVPKACDIFLECLENCDFSNAIDIKYQCYLNYALLTTDYENALDKLSDAEQLGIKSRRLYKIRADVYEKLDEPINMRNALLDALSNVPLYSSDWTDDSELFNGYIEDRLSLFYYYQEHNYPKAIEYCVKALQYDPSNERINNNLDFYYNAYKESRGLK